MIEQDKGFFICQGAILHMKREKPVYSTPDNSVEHLVQCWR